jgi:hypothetical protein
LKTPKGGNQNPYIEEEQTTQWSNENVQKDKRRSTKHTHKTKDRVTRTPLKTVFTFLFLDPQTERNINTEKTMILLRMLLGEMFVLNDRRVFTRPPCKICISDRCSYKSHSKMGDWYYDSIVVDGQWNFREFLVFEMSKCYPEYVISYRRVQTN